MYKRKRRTKEIIPDNDEQNGLQARQSSRDPRKGITVTSECMRLVQLLRPLLLCQLRQLGSTDGFLIRLSLYIEFATFPSKLLPHTYAGYQRPESA